MLVKNADSRSYWKCNELQSLRKGRPMEVQCIHTYKDKIMKILFEGEEIEGMGI